MRQPEREDNALQATAWQKHVTRESGFLDMGAYVYCTLEALRTALRHRDVFVSPSWRYADPRTGLLDGAEWLAARPIICRSLGLTIDAGTTLDTRSAELDSTWLAVAARLPDNPAIQLSENTECKTELSLGALDNQLVVEIAGGGGRPDAACRSAGDPLGNRRPCRLRRGLHLCVRTHRTGRQPGY